MNPYLETHHGKMIRSWLRIIFLNLFVATCIGALLRFAFIVEIPWLQFRNWLHGHSHIAILGWGYLILYVLLLINFQFPDQLQRRFFNLLFWITQGSVVGMAISFPLQGYGLFSIFFSTCHVILAYIFLLRFWKILNTLPKKLWSVKFAKTAVYFFIISSLALWAMGPIMKLGLQQSTWYYQAIQFYLHFQFNGWFLFAVIALFLRWLEQQNIQFSYQKTRFFHLLLIVATVLTFALAVTWSNPKPWLFWINGSGLTIQLFALIVFVQLIRKHLTAIIQKISHPQGKLLLAIAMISFTLKIVFQTMIILPFVSTIAYTIRNFVIGFLHLILLGVLTMFCLGMLSISNHLKCKTRIVKWGLFIFIATFIFTEGLLFTQGLFLWTGLSFIPFYYEILAISSALFPISIVLLSSSYLKPESVG